jgi:hypothetical protein
LQDRIYQASKANTAAPKDTVKKRVKIVFTSYQSNGTKSHILKIVKKKTTGFVIEKKAFSARD